MTPPTLETAQAEFFLRLLRERLPAFAPGWQVPEGTAGDALLRIYARYLQILAERINRAPHKNRLALLDMLGLSLIPDQAARAPVVFEMQDDTGNSRAPQGLQLGASVPGMADPLTFETETTLGLTSARLAEVVAIVPGQDAYANHTSDVIGGQPFVLFQGLQPTPHALYLAHNTHFALSGDSTIELRVQLARPADQPVPLLWEYWDGEAWRAFAPFVEPQDDPQTTDSVDGTDGLRRSGIIRLVAKCGENKPTVVNHIEAFWIRARPTETLPPDPRRSLPVIDTIRVRTVITHYADPPASQPQPLDADSALANGVEVDLSKTFFPFGQQTHAGSAFYFTSEEIFTKPHATVYVWVDRALTPQEKADSEASDPHASTDTVSLAWEYWDGSRWQEVPDRLNNNASNFRLTSGTRQGYFTFSVPETMELLDIGGTEAYWVRARIASGSFNVFSKVTWTDEAGNTNTIPIVNPRPVVLDAFKLGYEYASEFDHAEWCFSTNDFQWQDRTDDSRWHGRGFEPFSVVMDRTPTVYFGFEGALPPDLLGIFFDIAESTVENPRLLWEYSDGVNWLPLTVIDDTAHLSMAGMLQFVWPGVPLPETALVVRASGTTVELMDARQATRFRLGDQLYIRKDDEGELNTLVGISRSLLTLKTPLEGEYEQASIGKALLPRFGTPRLWLRAHLQHDGDPPEPSINGVFPNAVWASQVSTVQNEVIGHSNGQKNQVFFLRQTPILDDHVIEVLELEGGRAEVELPILREELEQTGHPADAIRTEINRATGCVDKVFVRWLPQAQLYFSKPTDRHYVLDNASGRLLFGDDVHGMIPPSGRNNILARRYRYGGGREGNVAAGTISQVLGAVPGVRGARNIWPAAGGAAGELIETVHARGSHVLRHRLQAISLRDYETLAIQASPDVAVARALPNVDSAGFPAKGWVRLVIIQQSTDPRPQPSFELRQRVKRYLQRRMPVTAAGRLSVVGPDYLPVDVEVTVAPRDVFQAGRVFELVLGQVQAFLHPLTGGPDGAGFPFGRSVYLSDVAAALEGIAEVDFVESLYLLLEDVPQGEEVAVPPGRIVCAGKIDVRLVTR